MGQLSATRAFAWELLTAMRLAGGRASPLDCAWALAASHGTLSIPRPAVTHPDDVDHIKSDQSSICQGGEDA